MIPLADRTLAPVFERASDPVMPLVRTGTDHRSIYNAIPSPIPSPLLVLSGYIRLPGWILNGEFTPLWICSGRGWIARYHSMREVIVPLVDALALDCQPTAQSICVIFLRPSAPHADQPRLARPDRIQQACGSTIGPLLLGLHCTEQPAIRITTPTLPAETSLLCLSMLS